MPNICTATIIIRGYKPNVDLLVDELRADYHYYDDANRGYRTYHGPGIPHFYRVFECHDVDEQFLNDGTYLREVDIECAWSVTSCLFNEPLTYYNDCITMPDYPTREKLSKLATSFRNNYYSRQTMPQKIARYEMFKKEAAEHILHSTHILWEAQRLNLQVAIKSVEPGLSFSEDIYMIGGALIRNDCNNYNEYYIGDNDTKAAWEEDYGCEIPLTEQEYLDMKSDNVQCYCPDADIAYFNENEPIFTSIYPVKKVMCKLKENKKNGK